MAQALSVCPGCCRQIQSGGVPCRRCGTAYHAECRDPLGCVVAGCVEPRARQSKAAPAPPVSRAWRGMRWSGAFALLSLAVVLGADTFGVPYEARELLGQGALWGIAAALVCMWAGCLSDLWTGAARDSWSGTMGLLTFTSTLGAVVGLICARSTDATASYVVFATSAASCVFGLAGVGSDGARLRAAGALLLGGLSTWAALIVMPAGRGPNARANTRACYANQKTIAGAVEMYNLDHNTKRTRLDAAFYNSLRSGGYLQTIPTDPGAGFGSSANYQLTQGANGVSCIAHGGIQ